VVIATLDRLSSLRVVLECLGRQTCPPMEIIIAAAGGASDVQQLANEFPAGPSIRVIAFGIRSSAQQRNAAAALARGEVIAFLDDDIEFGDELFAQMLAYFASRDSAPGAIAARISADDRRRPGWFTRTYYRLQAGFPHPDFGGRLFGPGINCTPVYPAGAPELYPSDWLPATCLMVQTDLFRKEQFPSFEGYSFAEDVHLTARIARRAPLFFTSLCPIVHHSLPSEFKKDRAALTAGKLHNMGIIARDILGFSRTRLTVSMTLHRLFLTLAVLRSRPPQWRKELSGIWTLSP